MEIELTTAQIDKYCLSLAQQIKNQNMKYSGIFPVLRGGYVPALN